MSYSLLLWQIFNILLLVLLVYVVYTFFVYVKQKMKKDDKHKQL